MLIVLSGRYTYFPCSRRQFGLLGPSLLEVDHDEVPEEGTLASTLAVCTLFRHFVMLYSTLRFGSQHHHMVSLYRLLRKYIKISSRTLH